jgi:hypothetical protein
MSIEGAIDTQVFGAYIEKFLPLSLLPGDEECISKIKEARTLRKLLNALARAIDKVIVDDICGWFAHCSYIFSFI